jgi:hydrogenase-4 component B
VLAVVVDVFRFGADAEAVVFRLGVLGASLAIVVDPLSAFFLLIAVTICVLSVLFSVHYMTHFVQDSVAKFYPILLLFFASIIGVLVASDLLFFLVFWELMTLTSFFLVAFERENVTSQRAGRKYFIMTHAATLCMVAAALLLWRSAGTFDFEAMRGAMATLFRSQPVLANVVVLLFLLGFATKAGVLPMGDWLPDAHPVAPSGMSAMLSGVLVKIGIYGLLRVVCDFVPVGQSLALWGVVIAVAGGGSLLVGNLTALKQADSKRLMAFSTIGQIGYVCLGIGAGLHMLRTDPTLATLAFMGALFHVANHACFKACLFLGAGSVLFRTGERHLDALGGLGASMPVTAASSTVAALSIAGVPPLNGFASKWLILATCALIGLHSPLFLVLSIVGLFGSLATLGAFLTNLSAVFLGRPDGRRAVREVPWTMAAPQVILAALCVVLGVFPQGALRAAHAAIASVAAVPLPTAEAVTGGGWGVALVGDGAPLAMWGPLVIVGALVALSLLAYGIQRAGAARVRQVDVWTGGEEQPIPAVRYPATSYFLPFKQAFRDIYPTVQGRAPAFPLALRRAFDLDRWLYGPAARAVDRTAHAAGRTHSGVPQVYLLWIVVGAAAVVTLLFLTVR